MCGICVLIESKDCCQVDVSTSKLLNRGPDSYSSLCFHADSGTSVELHGSVLVLRHHLARQPLTDENGNALLWNGEIFGGVQVSPSENDGAVLLELLTKTQTEDDILKLFGRIQGPWSFAFWQHKTQTMWFGRDIFGRRSLLWSLPHTEDSIFGLSSISIKPLSWTEVPAAGIYSVNLSQAPKRVKLFPWQNAPAYSVTEADVHVELGGNADHFAQSSWMFETITASVPVYISPFNVALPTEDDLPPIDLSAQPENCDRKKNSENEVSGDSQIDTSRPSLNSAGCLELHSTTGTLPEHVNSDLLRDTGACQNSDKLNPGIENSAEELVFQNLSSNTGATENYSSVLMGDKKSADQRTRKVEVSKSKQKQECLKSSCDLLRMATKNQLDVAGKFLTVLGEAVRVRVQNQMDFCDQCLRLQLKSNRCEDGDGYSGETGALQATQKCVHARVGILFSGGIDSLMIAALADRFIPLDEPIDLMNVAFEIQPKQVQHKHGQKSKRTQSVQTDANDPYLVPDRITGLSGLEELKALNPKRKWNFIEVNITLEELKKMRDEHICHLVYPLQTVLDDSIGCAVWFAARGEGIIKGNESTDKGSKLYKSTARVVLVGMGADEQLAGYSRHRNAFRMRGWPGLAEELRMEINRISGRNLGRDDRIITDHGKESRFPFLDENVVSFLNSLPVWHKADLRLERGFGEKILLRQCAELLGLHKTAILPKRAIQFGSRIAKIEDRKEKASDVCNRLQKVTVKNS